MKRYISLPILLVTVCAILAAVASAQTTPAPAKPAANASPNAAPAPNRASAYFHSALADMYEEEAVNTGRQDDVQHAIDEYKYAINADPGSPQLQDALADLYFRVPGHMREAEATAKENIQAHPDDVDAHKLLGRIYLRQLGDQQNSSPSAAPSGNTVDLAIGEFEKIVALKPNSVEDHMILGQLYTVKHESAKAEEQFKTARAIEPDSEEVILNLARVYDEGGNPDQAAKVIESVPETERTARMEFTLGATYEQLKRNKDAIAAYQRAADLQPDDVQTLTALGQAQINDSQYDAALTTFRSLAKADSEDAAPLIKIAGIERSQGKYEDALASIRLARKREPENMEAGYQEGMLLDILGRFDEAEAAYQGMVDQLTHANGAYRADEKNNRGIFLERLGSVYHEQNKTEQAIATFQKMVAMGGDQATQGYQLEVDAYNDAKMFDQGVQISKQAVATDPKNADLKLMLAGELLDQGQTDGALAMAKGMLNNTDDDRKVYFALGNMDTRLRRWKDADDALNKATPLCSKKDDKLYLLFLKGALADRQKHMDEAESYFRQALSLDPTNAMTLNYLGFMFADKGVRLPEALKLIRKAVDEEPMNGAYLDSLGWVYFKMGDYELAEDNLRQAVERDQTDPTVHDHLGDLYEKTGRIRQAAEQWQLSVSEFHKTPVLDQDASEMAKVEHKLETARVKLAKQDSALGIKPR